MYVWLDSRDSFVWLSVWFMYLILRLDRRFFSVSIIYDGRVSVPLRILSEILTSYIIYWCVDSCNVECITIMKRYHIAGNMPDISDEN